MNNLDQLSPARETTKTVVRGGGGKKKLINLDDCYVCFDLLDADGNLMDLSLHNSRSRTLDVLTRKSTVLLGIRTDYYRESGLNSQC